MQVFIDKYQMGHNIYRTGFKKFGDCQLFNFIQRMLFCGFSCTGTYNTQTDKNCSCISYFIGNDNLKVIQMLLQYYKQSNLHFKKKGRHRVHVIL